MVAYSSTRKGFNAFNSSRFHVSNTFCPSFNEATSGRYLVRIDEKIGGANLAKICDVFVCKGVGVRSLEEIQKKNTMRKVILLLLIATGLQAQQSIPAIRGEINTYFPTNNAKQIQAVKLRETFNDVLDHVDTLNKKKYGKTITQIRAINNNHYEIVYVLDSLKQGWFYYDNDDTATADDGNNTIVAANGYRYKRSIILAPVVSVNGKTGVVVLNKDDIFGIDSIETKDIKSDAVTYAKMQNVVTNQRVLGRTSGAGGNVEELSLSQMMDWASSTQGTILYRGASGWVALAPSTAGFVLRTGGAGANPSWGSASVADGDKGDITVSGNDTNWTIDNSAVTYAKIQNVSATNRLLGRSTAGAGAVEEITVGGDISQSGSNFTINANAVVDADIRQSAGLSVIGRSASTTGNVADITAANDGDVLRRSGTSLGFGTVATAGIANSAVTYAKIQNVSATQRVLGRNTAGAGVTEEVSASGVLDWIGATQGQILFRGASGWSVLGAGVAGQLLSTGGAGSNPSWVAAPGSPFASDISTNSVDVGRGGGNISDNTRVGTSAFAATNTQGEGTAIGYFALKSNTSGANNTAIGAYALENNTTQGTNTAVGARALRALTGGSSSTAVGWYSAFQTTSGTGNTSLGSSTLYSNISGSYNTAIGYQALQNNTGGYNTAVGFGAGQGITSSIQNTIIGQYSSAGLTTGNYNTIIGSNISGLSSSLSNNIIIADGQGNRRINVDASGRVGIGTNTPSTTAILDLTSTTGGLLLPRMTTTQRDAIVSPPAGLLIFNTTTDTAQVRTSTTWVSL